MLIDLNLLNLGFTQLRAEDGGAQLLQALTRPGCAYVVVPDGPAAQGSAWLMVRSALIDDLLEQSDIERIERDRWASTVAREPRLLPYVMAHSWFDGPSLSTLQIDLERGLVLAPAMQSRVEHRLGEWLHRAPVVPMVQGSSLAPEEWPSLAVIADGNEVVGVFDERALGNDQWRGATLAGAEAPAPFVAHPRITALAPPRLDELLHFTVGLSDRPDAEADQQQRIRIDDPQPGDMLTVHVSAEGAVVQEPTLFQLPLDLMAEQAFTAQPLPGAARVVLCAQYMFRGRLLGSIAKTLAVQAADVAIPVPQPMAEPVRPLADAAAVGAVDIRLFVRRHDGESIVWQAHEASSGRHWGPLPVYLPNAQAFAKRLADLRRVHGDTGPGAHAELVSIGQDIAGLIPQTILHELIVPALANGGTPSVQILTNEPFVPWELARLPAAQAGRDAHAFLGACARISRWWTQASSSGPPSQVCITHLSAVAASAYSLGSNRDTLTFAIAERDALRTAWQAMPIEAVKADVDAWLDRTPHRAGHLAHIALHGYSDAQAEQQGLVLGDGAVLTPARLAGEWYVGEVPRFDMVFLNACQVGTGAERLGRMAGFPAALVRGGVSAFVAPLWEVQDQVALEVSRGFYQHTLADGVAVGEALRRMREATVAGGSITPLAYLYYGHPGLQLAHAP